jgi:triacylglycerol lipase
LKKLRLAPLVALVLIAGLAGCTTHPPAGRAPVIFVHGWAEDGTMWDSAVAALTAQGYAASDLNRFDYASTGEGAVDAVTASEQLAARVDEVRQATGRARVDIVAHSLGNLVTKHCIVEGGCAGKVAHWANLAGAQNGTEIAVFCSETDPACVDMLPGSALITRLQDADDAQIAAQKVKVQVHWSAQDGVIIPPEGSQEPYADNIQVADTLTHLMIPDDPGVLADTVRFLSR